MSNVIQIFLDGKDGVSPILANVRGNVAGLEKNISGVGLAIAGWQFAFRGVEAGIGKITSLISDASRAQGDQISTASTFAAVTGKSYQESISFVRDFNRELTVMANDLPGTAQDYKTIANAISDNLVGAFKDAKGNLDIKPFKDTLKEISGSFGALSSATGVDAFSTSDALARLLDGQTNALKLIFFDKNPVVKNLLNAELAKQGKSIKDWAAIDLKMRASILKTVAGKTLTDDVRKASAKSLSAIGGTIQSNLFDPESGIFGLLRQLDKKKPDSNVLVAFAQNVTALWDLFTESSKTLKLLGFDLGDPMQRLFDATNWFTAKIKYVTSSFKKLNDVISVKGLSELSKGDAIAGFLKNIGYGIKKLSSNIADWLGSNTPAIVNFITTAINGVAAAIPGLVASIDWGSVGKNFSKIVAGIDWVALGKAWFVLQLPGLFMRGGLAFGVAVGRFFAVQAVSFFVANAASPILGAIIKFGIASSSAITALIPKVVAMMGASVSAIAFGAVAAAGIWIYNFKYIHDNAKGFQELSSASLNAIGIAYQGWMFDIKFQWLRLKDWGVGQWTNIQKAGADFYQGIVNKWNSLGNYFSNLWNGVTSAVAGFIGNIKNRITNPFNLGGSSVPTPSPTGQSNLSRLSPAFNGYIPNAAGGFWDAINREVRAMPPGARPLIANTSELILNRKQQSQLGGVFSPQITVNAAPGMDEQAIVNMVFARLEQEWNRYSNSRLVVG